ncbi:MAG: tetratricopeptide repeat protein [Deltaproteobacteria bacterium]|nr:tetratricopeptide repeat protein [Deltaproteobacteria bacterium]
MRHWFDNMMRSCAENFPARCEWGAEVVGEKPYGAHPKSPLFKPSQPRSLKGEVKKIPLFKGGRGISTRTGLHPRFQFVLLMMACAVLFQSPQANARQIPEFNTIEQQIDSYRMEDAKARLHALSDDARASAEGLYLRGKYLFYAGQYKQADTLLKQAIEGSRTELDWKYLRDQTDISRRNTDTLQTAKPQKGFTFHYRNGADALLIPYALEALNAQRRALKKSLGETVHHIRVYIVPNVQMLSELCGLSTEQIEATGTVAVSKYNRIMILSPSLIVGGYPWLDTLAHELTHILITKITANRAPIWLHEGVAKLLEGQWRGVSQTHLTPVLAYLLDQAVREKRLIPLRRFHPSVSYLPNQEDAALAYAQGLSFLRFVTERFRDGNSLKTLLALSAEKSLDGAFTISTAYGINKLYGWWQKNLEGSRNTPITLVPMMQRRFKTIPGNEKSDIDPILDREVRRHIRVGDLLRIRGHVAAARQEYEWALQKNETPTPDIVDRLVSTLLAEDRAEEALALLAPMESLYPNHFTVFLQAGEAHTKLGQVAQAKKALRAALALNPFHAEVHCMLSAIYEGSGEENKSAIEKEACLKLSSAAE